VWEEEEEELLLVLLVLMAVAQRSRLDLGCRKRAPLMELLVTAELFLCSARLTPGLHRYRSLLLGDRSLLLGCRSLLLGYRSLLLGCRSLLLGYRSLLLGHRSLLLGYQPSNSRVCPLLFTSDIWVARI